MTIKDWLIKSENDFRNFGIKSARLDALVLLEFSINKDRAWVLAHDDFLLDEFAVKKLTKMVKKRIKREPIAYIIGKKEFYGHVFRVTKDVLIPRPESEAFLELLKRSSPEKNQKLIDVGCGSGALAINAKLLYPILDVSACDISEEAIKIAKYNANNLKAKINFIKSDLLKNCNNKYNYILANLPYVPYNYDVSPEVKHEPNTAVYAENNGLELIINLANQATDKLEKNGLIFIECLPKQSPKIDTIFIQNGFKKINSTGLITIYGCK